MKFQPTQVTELVKSLSAPTQRETRVLWLRAVAARVLALRPDLAKGLLRILEVHPLDKDLLKGCSIGEIGVCYEALLAQLNSQARRSSGQYFTPDDTAKFMAEQSTQFPPGTWMDPCCGVGNLAWHLAAVQPDPAEFVRDKLILIDRDGVALKTAVALIATDFLAPRDLDGLSRLQGRTVKRNFLSPQPIPKHDYVIVNPPFARAPVKSMLATGSTRETFAYFMERIAETSSGFVAVTPASYLSAPKFQTLRTILDHSMSGGRVFTFDNVPDTLFRGYKFGSTNTSTTNFVRAAVTVCDPSLKEWETTPILRWKSVSRERMLRKAPELLGYRHIGPTGEWVKAGPHHEQLWIELQRSSQTIADITVPEETQHRLTVALTPRYFISASFRDLQRGSKANLSFADEIDLNRAALILNSSIPYFWWRVLDGGVTLPRRVLASIPVPRSARGGLELISELRDTEEASVVTKLNAGSINENVKRPKALVRRLDEYLLGEFSKDLDLFYSEDMFEEPGQCRIEKGKPK
jgi:hypothetical protein